MKRGESEKEISSCKSGYWLDLTDKKQRRKLRKRLGGSAFRKRFPLFSEALGRMEIKKSDRPRVGLKAHLGNTVMVDYLIYSSESKTLSAHILGFFSDYVTGTGQLKVIDGKGNVLEKETFVIRNEKFVCNEFSWKNFDIMSYWNETLKARFELITVNRRGIFSSGTFQYQMEGCQLASTIVQSIKVSEPMNQEEPDEDIKVLLAKRRSVTQPQESYYDYDYQSAQILLPDQCDNVFLDFSGSVAFSDSSMVFKGFKAGTCDLWLYNKDDYVGYDMKNYGDFLRACFRKQKGGFRWNLNYVNPEPGESEEKKKLENINWHKTLPIAFQNTTVNYYFHGHFIYGKEGDPSSNEEGCFLLSSALPEAESGAYKKKMPRIRFYAGCLGAKTQVTMADGTKKTICQVQKGERVKAPGNKTALVKDLITGWEEKDLFCMRVHKQERYTVITGSHVLRTRRARLPVSRLRMDDEILAEDGSFRLLEELFPVKGGKIYNLLLEEPGEFYADGLCVGDYDIQNTYIYQEEKPEVSEELLEEAEALTFYLHEKEKAHGKMKYNFI